MTSAIDSFRKSGKPVIAFSDFYDQRPVLRCRARRRDLSRSAGRRLHRRLRELRPVRQGRDRQARDRLERLPRRPIQVRGRDVQPQRHVAGRARREPGLAQLALEHLQGRRRQGTRASSPSAAELCRRRRGRAASAPAATSRKMALDAGLVTALKGRYRCRGAAGADHRRGRGRALYMGVDHWAYLANVHSRKALSSEPVDKVGVIVASGEIVPGEQSPGTIGSRHARWPAARCALRRRRKAVVLRIDSPGGSTSRARSSGARSPRSRRASPSWHR